MLRFLTVMSFPMPFKTHLNKAFSVFGLMAIVLGLGLGVDRASAQAVMTAVNGDPVTSYDVDEYSKILKVSRRPASRADAVEAVISDHLKFDEAKKWGVDAADSDITAVLNRVTAELKVQPQAWLQAIQAAHIDMDVFRTHLRALAAWDVYVRVRNKTLGVSEAEISTELAKQGGAKITDYSLRQIVFVLPAKATLATMDSRLKDAQALRNRFTDCDTGLQLARALPDVAVKEQMTRASDVLSPTLRNLLADTPKGRLTPPERGSAGIELIAVCDKSDQNDQTSARDRMQNQLITRKLQAVSQTMYKELRATAVISKN